MRCKNKNCKVKLTRDNKHTFLGYSREDVEAGRFSTVGSAVKIHVCIDCAKMYIGKYYKEDTRFTSFINQMEFSAEFQQDIFTKVSG